MLLAMPGCQTPTYIIRTVTWSTLLIMAYVAPWCPPLMLTYLSFAYLHRSRQDQLVFALHAAVLASGYRLVAVAENAQLEGKRQRHCTCSRVS
jgi:hypothetical protein